jgi:hypothetical protein
VARELAENWTYVDRGRDFARRRVDCYGLYMYLSLRYMNLRVPELLDYYEGAIGTEATADEGKRSFVAVDRGSARLGDLALLNYRNLSFHAAFCTGPDRVLHIGHRSRVAHVSMLPDTAVGRRLEGIYRYGIG